MVYDVIIIGAGPGGMTAALYASRSNLSVLLIEKGLPGGQMNNTAEIENYTGFESILGPDLSMYMLKHTEKFGVKLVYDTVETVTLQENIKIINGLDNKYRGKSVIVATGASHRLLGVPGEDTYSGRGVSYCAVCDGAFFRNKELVVVGGGDSAIEEANYLTQFADQVTIVHRREKLRAQKILQDRIFTNPKVRIIWDSTVEEIIGDKMSVTGVRIKNVKTQELIDYSTSGVFIYVGMDPLTKPFSDLGITNSEGWIQTDSNMNTKQSGIFAVGDVRDKKLRQITTAVGDGGIAGQEVYAYLESLTESGDLLCIR